ncbi:unnamed protein product [Ambrosiozyma monospora]|uniref:Unnamed protein product n=1 Tax=Ambrosiozyma monospora TaxID=43982 RepID=A0ACB5U3Z0_AMBMO|nr:unnamed protein product [Ambrosiozyma monospora]
MGTRSGWGTWSAWSSWRTWSTIDRTRTWGTWSTGRFTRNSDSGRDNLTVAGVDSFGFNTGSNDSSNLVTRGSGDGVNNKVTWSTWSTVTGTRTWGTWSGVFTWDSESGSDDLTVGSEDGFGFNTGSNNSGDLVIRGRCDGVNNSITWSSWGTVTRT